MSVRGLVLPEPKKRSKTSWIRGEAAMPDETCQADFTHYLLTTGTDVEILTFLDDHSRMVISCTALRRVTGPIVLATFRAAVATYGVPVSTLTDNGMVFTTRLAGGRGGRNGFEAELRPFGVVEKNSTPGHPAACGKVEQFQQTLRKCLRLHQGGAQRPPCAHRVDRGAIHLGPIPVGPLARLRHQAWAFTSWLMPVRVGRLFGGPEPKDPTLLVIRRCDGPC